MDKALDLCVVTCTSVCCSTAWGVYIDKALDLCVVTCTPCCSTAWDVYMDKALDLCVVACTPEGSLLTVCYRSLLIFYFTLKTF